MGSSSFIWISSCEGKRGKLMQLTLSSEPPGSASFPFHVQNTLRAHLECGNLYSLAFLTYVTQPRDMGDECDGFLVSRLVMCCRSVTAVPQPQLIAEWSWARYTLKLLDYIIIYRQKKALRVFILQYLYPAEFISSATSPHRLRSGIFFF